jgi:transposase-like protein
MVLPPGDVGRWVASRKAQVVAAILTGAITVEDACTRYSLGEDELQQWIAAFRDVGEDGLRSRRHRREYKTRYQQRFEVAPEGATWMVVDLETRRTAIAEDVALNGLMLREAVALAEALNFLHRRLWKAVRH